MLMVLKRVNYYFPPARSNARQLRIIQPLKTNLKKVYHVPAHLFSRAFCYKQFIITLLYIYEILNFIF